MRLSTLAVSASLIFGVTGCDKIQSRDLIRDANALYNNADYEGAIKKYDEAEALDADVAELYWNRACSAEALVLRYKDNAEKASDRKRYGDMALQDFRKWKDRLKEPTEDDRKNFSEHRLAILSADQRCDDLIAHWQEKLQRTPASDAKAREGLYSVIARTYDDTCDDKLRATQWFVKRTKDFPQSAPAWYALGVRKFEPLFPPAGSETPYNDSLTREERLKRADEVIEVLQVATKLKPNYRDPYVWRAMAHTQKSLARAVTMDAVDAQAKLEAIFAREDAMAAWKEQRQVCNIDKLPDCPMAPTPTEIFGDLSRFTKPNTFLTLSGKSVPGSAKAVPGKDRTLTLAMEVKVEEPEAAKPRRSRRRKKQQQEPAKPRVRKEVVQVEIKLAAPQKDEEGKVIDDAEEIKARLDAWNEGQRVDFDGQLSGGGHKLAVQERANLGCCPPAPITDADVAADLALKKDLQDSIADGGSQPGKKKRRRRRRRRR